MKPVTISRRLAREVDELSFGAPVTHVYNPLLYARRNSETYLQRYARRGCEAILLGMNPGPFGMAQTGVPFGEVGRVRNWLQIDGAVERPSREHPKRPVLGMECQRREVSGARLWGWAEERFGNADRFFDRFFVWNYCPLLFMEESGKNRTPDKLPAAERAPLEEACDRALVAIVESLRPGRVIGIGRFAERRARRVLPAELSVDTILHPSPASPTANRGWAPQAEAQLRAMGLRL